MPTAAEIEPYLRKIDHARWYSNFGPLSREFEARLAAHFGVAPENVVTVSSATAGLTLSLMAQCGDQRGLCLSPAFTFAATPACIKNAGLVPCFVDVDEQSWALEPEIARAALDPAPDRVLAAMPVMAFGAPLRWEAWVEFQERTGVPVVIDAAWGFDSVRATSVPAVVSLHASKSFGIGEGGVVVCTNADLIAEVRRLANFGFDERRVALTSSFNAKLSEFACAVGMAAFDRWATTRAAARSLANTYREALGGIADTVLLPGLDGSWASAICAIRMLREPVGDVMARLAALGVETRQWWTPSCDHHPAFVDCPRVGELPTTAALAKTVVNLPFSPSVTPDDVRLIRRELDGRYRNDPEPLAR